jgi:hypothetical protein
LRQVAPLLTLSSGAQQNILLMMLMKVMKVMTTMVMRQATQVVQQLQEEKDPKSRIESQLTLLVTDSQEWLGKLLLTIAWCAGLKVV